MTTMYQLIIKISVLAVLLITITALIAGLVVQGQKIKTLTEQINTKSAEIALVKQSALLADTAIESRNEAIKSLVAQLTHAKREASIKTTAIETAYNKKLDALKKLTTTETTCEATLGVINETQQIYLTEGRL